MSKIKPTTVEILLFIVRLCYKAVEEEMSAEDHKVFRKVIHIINCSLH